MEKINNIELQVVDQIEEEPTIESWNEVIQLMKETSRKLDNFQTYLLHINKIMQNKIINV